MNPNASHTHENLDPKEIAKFEKLASHWWDQEGDFKPLHQMNPLRANYIDARAPVAEKKILDIGCGGGILSEALAVRGADVTGIDMSLAPLDVARLHSLESGLKIHYEKATAEQFASQYPAAFDSVTCLEMLEHVPHPETVVKACADLTAPGGDCFFSTINRNPKAYAMAVIGAEYLLKMLPKGTHDYQKFIRPSELAKYLRDAGLQLCDVSGMIYNPLTKKFKLSDTDVDVNYIVHAKKPA